MRKVGSLTVSKIFRTSLGANQSLWVSLASLVS